MSRILIITDAFTPQVNGVVTTFTNTIKVLREQGDEVSVIHPGMFKTMALPTYKEIKIAINPWKVGKLIEKANADEIHIATEGPIGFFATRYCRRKGYNFTTSYHTKMPEYLKERFKWFPISLGYAYMRKLHQHSSNILVTTESMKKELINHGFKNDITVWGRGVDTEIFSEWEGQFPHYALYVGRISPEKNIQAFFDMDIPCDKIIIGDGPDFDYWYEKAAEYNSKRSKDNPYFINLVGVRKGDALASAYSNAKVFVFPSKTDTFGIVMLEAMACGTPVIGYPVTGPIDCVEQNVTGYLDDDLVKAYHEAVKLDRKKIAAIGQQNTWQKCTAVFKNTLVRK